MGVVVVINGPAGVGKTTTARLMAGRVDNGVCVHRDAVKDFVVTRDQERPRGLAYLGCAQLAQMYLAAGYEWVVVEFVFPDAASLRLLVDALPAGITVLVFTLWAPLAVVRAREAERVGRDRIPEMVVQSWESIRDNAVDLGAVVDACRPTAEVVADLEDRVRHLRM